MLGRLVTLVGLALWGGLFVVARAARRSGISPMRLEGLVRLATAAALVGSIAVVGDRLATTPVDVVPLAGGRVAQLDAIVLVSALVGAWSAQRHATATAPRWSRRPADRDHGRTCNRARGRCRGTVRRNRRARRPPARGRCVGGGDRHLVGLASCGANAEGDVALRESARPGPCWRRERSPPPWSWEACRR